MLDPAQAALAKACILRAELIHAQRENLATQLAAVYAEARDGGLNVKKIKSAIRRRADPMRVEADKAVVDDYISAVTAGNPDALAHDPLESD